MQTCPSEFINRKHFTLLNGIRGLSIFAVIWHHASGNDPFNSQIFTRGYLGVDMFFVLSGFLITFLLIKEKFKNNNVSLTKFYIRRTLRIFPLYFAFLGFLTVWILITSPEKSSEVLQALPYYILYISNWIPGDVEPYFHRAWSLAVEEQFYLVWPLLFSFLPQLRATSIIIAFIFLVTALDLSTTGGNLSHLIHMLLPFRTLLLGCLLAIALCNTQSYTFLKKVLTPKPVIIFVAGLLLYSIFRVEGPIIEINQLIVHILMVAFLACAVINENNILKGVLSWRPLQLCGIVSYGMYILHGLFWGISKKLTELIPINFIAESRITFFIIFIITSYFVAFLSFHFFEKWFLEFKEKYGSIKK